MKAFSVQHPQRLILAAALAATLPLAAFVTAPAAAESSAGQSVENATITGRIKAKLMADERTKAFDINVDTDGTGVVTLRGTAPTSASRQAAGELARSVDGVTDVRNELVVAVPGSALEKSVPPATASQKAEAAADHAADEGSDAWITTKVKTKFLADTDIKGLDISVSTEDGIVTLAGAVPSTTMRDRAIQVAQSTRNVKAVRTKGLVVEQ
jgi:osmotically-inducible protein OsmY